MKRHYDFGTTKGEPNPYLKQMKQPITIRLDTATVAYFKSLASGRPEMADYLSSRE